MQIAVIKAFFCGKVDFLSIYVANELFYARVDPNEMRLNRVGCSDVGVRCGGWGHIALEVKIEDRK